jgi:hypothetical protein
MMGQGHSRPGSKEAPANGRGFFYLEVVPRCDPEDNMNIAERPPHTTDGRPEPNDPFHALKAVLHHDDSWAWPPGGQPILDRIEEIERVRIMVDALDLLAAVQRGEDVPPQEIVALVALGLDVPAAVWARTVAWLLAQARDEEPPAWLLAQMEVPG